MIIDPKITIERKILKKEIVVKETKNVDLSIIIVSRQSLNNWVTAISCAP